MSYRQLTERFTHLHHLAHLGAICGWDRATMMPDGGNEVRAAALAELSVLMHERLTASELTEWFAVAKGEPLLPNEQRSLLEMHRQWQQASVRPPIWFRPNPGRLALRTRSARAAQAK